MSTRNLALLLVLTVLCVASRCQTPSDINRIRFTSITRGYHKEINITEDSVHTLIRGREGNQAYSRQLDAGEWDKLVASLKKVELKEISDLKSPTDRRAYDGAHISSLEVQTGEGETLIHSFDNEDPNALLKPLMQEVLKVEAVKP